MRGEEHTQVQVPSRSEQDTRQSRQRKVGRERKDAERNQERGKEQTTEKERSTKEEGKGGKGGGQKSWRRGAGASTTTCPCSAQ